MSWLNKLKKIPWTSIGIEFKLIGNNETDLRPGTNKLKWQTKLLEKAKNTQGRNIMKDVEVEEWMWKYGKGEKPKENMWSAIGSHNRRSPLMPSHPQHSLSLNQVIKFSERFWLILKGWRGKILRDCITEEFVISEAKQTLSQFQLSVWVSFSPHTHSTADILPNHCLSCRQLPHVRQRLGHHGWSVGWVFWGFFWFLDQHECNDWCLSILYLQFREKDIEFKINCKLSRFQLMELLFTAETETILNLRTDGKVSSPVSELSHCKLCTKDTF